MPENMPSLATIPFVSWAREAQKLAGAGTLRTFWEGARHEIGPAVGAVTGAGAARVLGIDPLAGAAAGYGLGASGDIYKAIKEKRLAAKAAKLTK